MDTSSMGSTGPATAILPIHLGDAAAFDQRVFPLAYYEEDGGNFRKGSLLIKATVREMQRIAQLGIDLNQNEDFIFNTRLKLEALRVQEAKLQDNRKTFNPLKMLKNYRAARLFHAGSKALYIRTKRTSEKIQREEQRMRVVPREQIRSVDGAISPSAIIGGITFDLPDGLTEDVRRTISDVVARMAATDPFGDDPLVSQLRDGEQEITLADTASLFSQDAHDSSVSDDNQSYAASGSDLSSRPTGAQTVNIINIIRDSILTTGSNVTGLTVNRDSSHTSGASVAQQPTP